MADHLSDLNRHGPVAINYGIGVGFSAAGSAHFDYKKKSSEMRSTSEKKKLNKKENQQK